MGIVIVNVSIRPFCLLFSLLVFTQVSSAGERLTFENFLKRVHEQNLDLKIESEKSKSEGAKSASFGIPAPMVGLMQMKEQGGDVAQGIEINQTIPFPTKISNSKAARAFEAKAQEEMRHGLRSEILAKAKAMYVSLWAASERLSLLKEKRNIIGDHIKLARAGARSDSFLRIHLLKVESDSDLLENETLSAEQILKEKQAEVAEFLNVEASDFNPILVEPPVSAFPNSANIKAPHQLESAKLTLESLKSRESESKSSWFPDLYVRYKELGETRMNPKYSEVMLGISLPFLFFWEPSSSSQQATAERARGEYEFEKQKRKIQTEVEVLLSRATSLKKQLENVNQRLLPRAERRMKIAHNVAPRDMEALQDHRETMEAFPELKLKSLELRIQFEDTIATLRKYERDTYE